MKTTKASATEERNLIDRRLSQLNALLECSHGSGRGWLAEMGEDNISNLLWLASDLGHEVQESFNRLVGLQAGGAA